MTANPKQLYTEDEYLAFERTSDTRHEFYRGEIFAMAGASENHNLISANTLAALHSQLRKQPCKTYPSDMRFKIPAAKLFTYADVSVVCGDAKFSGDKPDTLLNPTLIVEVLSDSTEAYDRRKKFAHYRLMSSLQEYILIAQDEALIEQYVRQSDSTWILTVAKGLDASFELPSINCTLALADVYERVTFNTTGDTLS